jgi:hypothetical protein
MAKRIAQSHTLSQHKFETTGWKSGDSLVFSNVPGALSARNDYLLNVTQQLERVGIRCHANLHPMCYDECAFPGHQEQFVSGLVVPQEDSS